MESVGLGYTERSGVAKIDGAKLLEAAVELELPVLLSAKFSPEDESFGPPLLSKAGSGAGTGAGADGRYDGGGAA